MVKFDTTPSSQVLLAGVTTVIEPFSIGYTFTSIGNINSVFSSTEIGSTFSFVVKAKLTNEHSKIKSTFLIMFDFKSLKNVYQ
ncbi:Putative protein [Zobellia galactanivorans]|uniref:Uncharacterized protein n=1 Tax=Zobellia galactanivorans (strain DSM 12802 / CCUG 47099 / CIP 106680 / NCIMB 13871 / Dsij) TaxID=63186 RepID=G0L8B0_ZOBGA|nr:Putative protein [Zobellia galactanivorans]